MTKLLKIDKCIDCFHCAFTHAYEDGQAEFECHENKKNTFDLYDANNSIHKDCCLCDYDESVITCPLCNHGIMKYKNNSSAHMWICPECPGILFEYWDKASYRDLGKHLSIDN